MKFFLPVFCLLSTATLSSNAMELTCQSRYWIGEPARVELTAYSDSEDVLTDVKMFIDKEEERSNESVFGTRYTGRKYKNMINYPLPGDNDHTGFASLSLILPQGWGEQGQFVGYIIEQANDGGSYNKVFCSTID